MKKYIPKDFEEKWQKKWLDAGLYDFKPSEDKNYYVLVELPYTSGDLHIGHWFAFTPPDIYARYKKMKGFNVFYPIGFDAFGLPAENAAIKRGIHPKEWTMKNIETMSVQFKKMGTMIDWNHQAITCSPDYYRWNQWIFIKMFEKGIAYLDKALLNWCPVDQTVLADENIENGTCWRCGTQVVKKEVDEWFLKITAYADKLLWDQNPKAMPAGRQVNWPLSVRVGQNNWIGKSEGLVIDFDGIEVFTTKPETTDGATFLVLAPEHPKVKKLTIKQQLSDIESYIKNMSSKTEQERKESKDKSGVFTGSYVLNPVTLKKIPVWIADYVLMGYGTGAIMAVPFADERDKEFAEKFDLPVIKTSFKAKPKGKKQINYHLRDWSISRQRYWGTPVPIIHCDKCGLVPVPEKDLPVLLPDEVDFTPQGKPPLATSKDFMEVKCPKCNDGAQRDAQTLDGFFDNSWYFFRYLDPNYQKGPFDLDLAQKLMPVDIYFGGAEHTLGHTMYSRFFTKFFKDLNLIDFPEYALKRVQHGVILGPDGYRMSKSRGNVINPDEQIKEYGADTVRLYLAFLGPYDLVAPWNLSGINGVYHFLQRVWSLFEKLTIGHEELSRQDLTMMNKTIKKVGDDIEGIKFNTAVAALMEWLNYLGKKPFDSAQGKGVSKEEYETFLKLLAPFAPHITEELWSSFAKATENKQHWSIHQQKWPEVDEKYLEEEQITIAVQINGKVRETVLIQKDMLNNNLEVEKIALKSSKVQKFLHSEKPKKIIYVPGKILSIVV